MISDSLIARSLVATCNDNLQENTDISGEWIQVTGMK